MPARCLRFVIVATSFDESSGGSVVLHRLCALIRAHGVAAAIWPIGRPARHVTAPLAYYQRITRQTVAGWIGGRFRTCPDFETPLASDRDLKGAIVVYPEIIAGNPLGAERVVRWFLHRPGYHTNQIEFGPRDLCFYFQEAFRDPSLGLPEGGLLQTAYVRDDVFRHPGPITRSGTCYMLRKAEGRTDVDLPHDALCLDGKSLQEIAGAFARCERFISFDPYTMYSRYAAMCGCLSIVVPRPGVTKEQWRPEQHLRYGIAYGWDDVDWALATQDKVGEALREQQRQAEKTVENFLTRCEAYFGPGDVNGLTPESTVTREVGLPRLGG